MYLANQRAGTHSTLRRGEVAGSTKKLFRQKGTGNARVGTRRTNKRSGGGTAKGPKPRDYEYHLPKKAVRAATRMAILSKFQDQEAVIVDDLTLPRESRPSRWRDGPQGAGKLDRPASEPDAGSARHEPRTWLIGRRLRLTCTSRPATSPASRCCRRRSSTPIPCCGRSGWC